MSTRLSDDQYRKMDGRLHKIKAQMRQREYPFDPVQAIRALQDVAEGVFPGDGRVFTSEVRVPELLEIEPDLRVVSDVRFRKRDNPVFGFASLQDHRDAHAMRDLAGRKGGVFGLSDVPLLLGDDGGLTNIQIDGFVDLVLVPGTRLRHGMAGEIQIPALKVSSTGQGWKLCFIREDRLSHADWIPYYIDDKKETAYSPSGSAP